MDGWRESGDESVGYAGGTTGEIHGLNLWGMKGATGRILGLNLLGTGGEPGEEGGGEG